MATFTGGPEDDHYRLRSSDGGATVTGGDGYDVLEVDWSDKGFPVRGQFDVRYGRTDAYLDDYLGGAQIGATGIEKLIVRFGRGGDQFNLAGPVLAEVDGGAGVDLFHGDFRTLSAGIAFALDEAAGAASALQGQGSSITGFERVSIFTGGGNDDLTGGALADVFSVGGGDNRVSGGAGDDQFLSGGGVNTVLGGDGADRWTGDYRSAGALTLTQTGAASYALSDGGSATDVETIELTLGAGDDRIEVGAGARRLEVTAGGGRDAATIDWSGATGAIAGAYIGEPGALQLADVTADRRVDLNQIEELSIAFGSGDDGFHLTGPLTATLDAGDGVDFFYGDVSASAAAVRFSVASMAGGAAASVGGSTLRGFERVELRTGSGRDVLAGGRYDDRFVTGLGDDVVRAGAGADEVHAGGGDDQVDGGPGDDRLFGDEGADTLSYAGARAGVTVDLAVAVAQDTRGGGTDEVAGFENLLGSAFADTLAGDDLANALDGGTGDDRLTGAGGGDALDGGDGADVLFGDAGDDRLAGGAGYDELYGGVGADLLSGGEGGDYLEGFDGNDQLRGDAGGDFVDGGAGDDILVGGVGDDRLFGGAGLDRIQGGEGADTLAGDAGADRFIFARGDLGTARGAADVILDFSHAERDRLDFRLVDADEAARGDQAFAFIGATAFSGRAGELRFERDATGLFVEGDTDGDALADFFVRLDGVQLLAAGDVLV